MDESLTHDDVCEGPYCLECGVCSKEHPGPGGSVILGSEIAVINGKPLCLGCARSYWASNPPFVPKGEGGS